MMRPPPGPGDILENEGGGERLDLLNNFDGDIYLRVCKTAENVFVFMQQSIFFLSRLIQQQHDAYSHILDCSTLYSRLHFETEVINHSRKYIQEHRQATIEITHAGATTRKRIRT